MVAASLSNNKLAHNPHLEEDRMDHAIAPLNSLLSELRALLDEIKVDISKSLNALLGRDPLLSISATEGQKALHGEPSFAPLIDRLPILGGRDHCIEAARHERHALPSPITYFGTCAAVGAAGGALFGQPLIGAGIGVCLGAARMVLYGLGQALAGFFAWLF